jgi:hypothetical protein
VGGKAWFAVGGRLPERNRDWVRHELTDAGWRTRLTVRHLVIMLPLCAVLALLPGAVWIRIAVPGLFLICSVGIVAMYADDIRVSRLRRHGLEAPDDPDLGRPSHLTGPKRRGAGWVAGGRGSAVQSIGFRGCRR